MAETESKTVHILCLEDRFQDAELAKDLLSEEIEAIEITWVKNKAEYLAALSNSRYDLILSDYNLPDINGLESLRYANELCADVPFICFSGAIGEEAAVRLLTEGAADYIIKDRMQRLPQAVLKALEMAKIKAVNVQAIEQIKESEKLFSSIANSTPGMMWMSGLDMGCYWFNQAWLNYRGRLMEEEIGDGWTEGVHPDDFEFCLNNYTRAFKAREQFTMEYRLKCSDNTYKWILDQGQPRYDGNNEFAGYIGACLDITQRKTDEKRIVGLNRVHSMLSNINKTIVRIRDMAVLNQTVCDIAIDKGGFQLAWIALYTDDNIDFSWSSIKGNNTELTDTFVTYANRSSDKCLYYNLIKSGKYYICNDIPCLDELLNSLRGLTGLFINSYAVFPIIVEQAIVGVFCLYSDETGFFDEDEIRLLDELVMDISFAHKVNRIDEERKAKEEEIIQLNNDLESRVAERTAQLEDLNKEMESFSHSVSHDLRSPLRIIDGFATILMEDYDEKLDDDAKGLILTIKKSISRMDNLIEDLMKLSKVVRKELTYTKINMTSLVQQVYNELTDEETKRNFKFTLNLLPPVIGDNILMYHVWANLISNAVKYSRPVPDKKITIGSTFDEDWVTYYIKDSGVGFDLKNSDRLFDPFFRMSNAKEFEGTGIGLANVKKVITRHGGIVWAESRPNEGSTFYFKLTKIKE